MNTDTKTFRQSFLTSSTNPTGEYIFQHNLNSYFVLGALYQPPGNIMIDLSGASVTFIDENTLSINTSHIPGRWEILLTA